MWFLVLGWCQVLWIDFVVVMFEVGDVCYVFGVQVQVVCQQVVGEVFVVG